MAEVRVEEVLARVQSGLEASDRDRVWTEVQGVERRGMASVLRLGELLSEAECRRLIQLLTSGDPPLPTRLLALPLALLGRRREGTASLVLHHLRHWETMTMREVPAEIFRAIGRCGALKAFEVLLEAKVYGDARVREGVAAGLGQIEPSHPAFSAARLVLGDLLLNDREAAVRHAAAEALQEHFSDRDQPALLRLSLEADPALRAVLKTLWASPKRASGVAVEASAQDRVLRYYVRTLVPGGKVLFYKEFESGGRHLVEEGQEDREPIEPSYTARSPQPDGRTLYTLYDGTLMVEHADGSVVLSLGRADWRTRSSRTGMVTIRVPVERPFEPRGSLTFRPDGVMRIRLEDGSIEEEHPDGRRIHISPMGLIEIVSPRMEQGIQIDVHRELLERQTAQFYVLLEHPSGEIELFGGERTAVPLPSGAIRAERLPFGALWVAHRDGRVTRELVREEVTHTLAGGRSVSFVPRGGALTVVGLKTFEPSGEVHIRYDDGSEIRAAQPGELRYRLPTGEWIEPT